MSYHDITLVGNLGRDPEMRYQPDGEAVTNFSVAVDASYTPKGGTKVDRTIWIRITTWGKQAEICNQYLKKGKKVLVVGTLVADWATGGPRLYEKRDGGMGSAFEVKANTVRFLSPAGGVEGEAPAAAGEPAEEKAPTDDIPF